MVSGIWLVLKSKFLRACLKSSKVSNEAPRRKRTGYQSGLKTNLDYGGHVVSPKPPSAYFTPPQADGVLENYNKMVFSAPFGS